MSEELWTAAEAAAHCGLSPSRFNTAIRDARIEPVKGSRAYRYAADEIRAFQKRRPKHKKVTGPKLSPEERGEIMRYLPTSRTAEVILSLVTGQSVAATALRLGLTKQAVHKHMDRWERIGGLAGIQQAGK